MNLNSRLFLIINGLAKKNRLLDAFGRAGAEFVIFAAGGWFVSSILIDLDKRFVRAEIFLSFALLAALFLAGYLLSQLIGFIAREPRPYLKFPEAKLFFKPLSKWKSFPSDHAYFSWLLFFVAVVLNLPGFWALGAMAAWISFGRVFAGVHYPFDIVGGLLLSALMTAVFYSFLVYF